MLKLTSRGSFSNSYKLLRFLSEKRYFQKIEKYAQMGVDALAAATPVRTGKTAASWGYKITELPGKLTITWTNTNSANGIPIVVLLYYGHGTPSGYYVQGRDFITPAIRPVFDEIANSMWKEVTSA